jgi:hypothetical protein
VHARRDKPREVSSATADAALPDDKKLFWLDDFEMPMDETRRAKVSDGHR